MKKIILLVVALPIFGKAQENLYANESHVVTLFFPSPIRQALTGAEHFTFSYNRDSGQHFGILQANKGDDSNLLVLTADGRAYAYGLSYSKHLPITHHFIEVGESIGRETETKVTSIPLVCDTIPKIELTKRIDAEKEMVVKGAEYVLGRKTEILKTKRKNGLILRLKELFYHADQVYVELEIQNRSEIDFELDILEIYRVNGKKGRRSSHQKLELKSIFKYNQPHIVRSGHGHCFVHVVPKFTLGDSEKLLVELHEKKGSRIVKVHWD
ncbi:DUF4138 domain-containing protein [Flagellimonas pacifica]|uniref:DUF4138 domain-containing protein n=1 Tax=Flagellimonas pacifica TaxID=1247520 RepID=A0A285MQU3_9FLAO|nr:DUF4138 domain-containing protein [Allomuricauda parva]SNY99540.1 protein of unknown function [Allomuricauda parva]